MGCGCAKGNCNVYFRARKEAAKYNERLTSREGAAEMLGLSVSSLADYELGITKVVPVDKVVLMAELYNSPELRAEYCKNECPIGKYMTMATTIKGIEGIALRLIKSLDSEGIKCIEKELLEIAEDGVISDEEKPTLQSMIERLSYLSVTISELRLLGEKILKEK